jgi:hypothetical protein
MEGTGSFPAVNFRRMALTTHFYLFPRLKKEQSHAFSFILGLYGLV